jgi:RHS repeat-associated protein
MDNDMSGGNTGVDYNYGFRIYDTRIAKFLSVDPLTEDYPELTPYQFASNTPIMAIDLDGLECIIVSGMNSEPDHFKDPLTKPKDCKDENYGKNFPIMDKIYRNYTNNTIYDPDFAWNVPGNEVIPGGGDKRMNRTFQTPYDRALAATKLVLYMIEARNKMIKENPDKKNEDLTLVGFSSGNNVIMIAAYWYHIITGKQVNIITVNMPARRNKKSIEHPCANDGINDMIIFETDYDWLRGLLPPLGNYQRNLDLSDCENKYQRIKVKSDSFWHLPWVKHFAKYIDAKSMEKQHIERLKPIYKNDKDATTGK